MADHITDAQILAAARALNRQCCDECGTDEEDSWKLYGNSYIVDAGLALRAAIGAAQSPAEGDEMLEPLIYAAVMHNGKPKTVAEFERAAANVADMLQRRAEVTHEKPVASIYISADGSREFDDWRVDLPPGNHQLFTAPRSAQPQPEQLPHPGTPEAEEMIDKLLAEYNRPANMKNAARAGYMAARRLLQHSRQPLPAVETESNLYLRLESLSKRLESSGRIDEHDTPDAYATILDAMNAALAVPATLSNVQPKGMPAAGTKGEAFQRYDPGTPSFWLRAALDCDGFSPEQREMAEEALVAQATAPVAEVTMADAIAAGDGTLHGAIDYWQERAHKAEAQCAAVQHGKPDAWIRWEWNRSGGKSLEFFKPDELSLADEARGVVYDPLYGRPLAPLSERAILDLAPTTMPIANDFDLLWFARAVERAHGIGKHDVPVQGSQS